MLRPIIAAAAILLFATGASSEQDPNVTALLASIKGKENRPAGEVFKNVTMLETIPAARFLRMMETGYAQSLGVHCDHCHVEDRWEADEKRPKRAAREMIVLTNRINADLSKLVEIDTGEATVNCTTCHRGYVKPTLQMR